MNGIARARFAGEIVLDQWEAPDSSEVTVIVEARTAESYCTRWISAPARVQ